MDQSASHENFEVVRPVHVKSKKSKRKHRRRKSPKDGCIVWAKLTGHRYWPAQIVTPSLEDYSRLQLPKSSRSQKLCVRFFGGGTMTLIHPAYIQYPFQKYYEEFTTNKSNRKFNAALKECEDSLSIIEANEASTLDSSNKKHKGSKSRKSKEDVPSSANEESVNSQMSSTTRPQEELQTSLSQNNIEYLIVKVESKTGHQDFPEFSNDISVSSLTSSFPPKISKQTEFHDATSGVKKEGVAESTTEESVASLMSSTDC